MSVRMSLLCCLLGLLSAVGPARSADVVAGKAGGLLQPFAVATADGERWGYRDRAGHVAIAPRFAYAGDFHDGLARAWIAVAPDPEAAEPPRWGYLRPDGRWAIPPRFQAAGEFSDGLAPVRLGGDFVLVDASGAVRRRLHDARERPPGPSAQCATLEEYVAELGEHPRARTFALAANPSHGEAFLAYEATPLRAGALAVVERGWEGESLALVLPRHTPAEGRALLERFARGRRHRDLTGQGEEGAVVWLMEDEQLLRLVERADGGIALHASRWAL